MPSLPHRSFKPKSFASKRHFLSRFSTSPEKRKREPLSRILTSSPKEPTRGAWIATGDLVEALAGDHWYVATVLEVFANGEYRVEYVDDENVELMEKDEVRPYQPYEESGGNEVVECKLESEENDDGEEEEDEYYEKCRVLHRDEDGFFQVVLEESGEFFDGAEIAILRRVAD